MAALAPEDARQVLREMARGLRCKPDLDVIGSKLRFQAVIEKVLWVEIQIEEALGNIDITHRIAAQSNSMTMDDAEKMSEALKRLARNLRTTLPKIEAIVQSKAGDQAVMMAMAKAVIQNH